MRRDHVECQRIRSVPGGFRRILVVELLPVAVRVGTPETLLIAGIVCLVGALIFMRELPALRKIIRPICVEKDVPSELALGLQSATQWPRPPVG